MSKPEDRFFKNLRIISHTPENVTNEDLLEMYKYEYIGSNTSDGEEFFEKLNGRYIKPEIPEKCLCGNSNIKYWHFIYDPMNNISIAIGSSCVEKFMDDVKKRCHNTDCKNILKSHTNPYCNNCQSTQGETSITTKITNLVNKAVKRENIVSELGLTMYEQYIFDLHTELFLSRINTIIQAREKRLIEIEQSKIRLAEQLKREQELEKYKIELAKKQKLEAEENRVKYEKLMVEREQERLKQIEQNRIHEEQLKAEKVARNRFGSLSDFKKFSQHRRKQLQINNDGALNNTYVAPQLKIQKLKII